MVFTFGVEKDKQSTLLTEEKTNPQLNTFSTFILGLQQMLRWRMAYPKQDSKTSLGPWLIKNANSHIMSSDGKKTRK